MRRMKRIRLLITNLVTTLRLSGSQVTSRRLVESVPREEFVVPRARLGRALAPLRRAESSLAPLSIAAAVVSSTPTPPRTVGLSDSPPLVFRTVGSRPGRTAGTYRSTPLACSAARLSSASSSAAARSRSTRSAYVVGGCVGGRRAGPRATSDVLGGGRPGRGGRRSSQHRVNIVAARCAMRLRAASIGGVGARRRLFLRSERRVDPRSPVKVVGTGRYAGQSRVCQLEKKSNECPESDAPSCRALLTCRACFSSPPACP